ncbi:MAG: zinc ribbon domain-containing protein [Nitrospira sp.]|nr:zinc ribbon domain-containing protein [Nitrospira sp.]
MPIYEYVCRSCKKRSSLLVLNYRNQPSASCRHCGGLELDRVMSRFAAPKSEEARMESLAESADLNGLDEQDPQSMARFMQKMKREMGEDFGDDLDMDAMMDQETPMDQNGGSDDSDSE